MYEHKYPEVDDVVMVQVGVLTACLIIVSPSVSCIKALADVMMRTCISKACCMPKVVPYCSDQHWQQCRNAAALCSIQSTYALSLTCCWMSESLHLV
jgi:hypothetical protein